MPRLSLATWERDLEEEPKDTYFDYTKQAWVKNGRYIRCGHTDSCNCYGRLNEGKKVTKCTK